MASAKAQPIWDLWNVGPYIKKQAPADLLTKVMCDSCINLANDTSAHACSISRCNVMLHHL